MEHGVELHRSVTKENPFATAKSNYCRHDGTRLVCGLGTQSTPSPMTTFVHDNVVALVLNPQYSCLGAKSTVRQRSYRFGLYPRLGAPDSALALAHDLHLFVTEAPGIEGDFATFIASFESPPVADECVFERLLWDTLQQLRDLDAAHYRWAREVSSNPADPAFAFSFAETALFVVGLHAGSSRVTRRVAWPTLVFNPHSQFEGLRRSGRFARFRHVIREGERRLQGMPNPMSTDFGQQSEAAQYSGREVDSGWQCPFASRVPDKDEKP
jgi:FPC/CPF motif-containing protein YcgG